MSKGVPILEEFSYMIGSYMATDQTRGEVQYVNSWDYNSYHENNLPIQYYSGWRNHENLHYENPINAINPPAEFQLPQQEQPSERKPSLEDILSSFIARSDTQLEETEARLDKQEEMITHMNASVRNLETQIGQLATTLNSISKSVFPSNTEKNPREHCKAITLRSGKELEPPTSHDDQHFTPTLVNQDGAEYKEEEEKKEEPAVKEVKATLELKQLPKSLRYALLGNDSFFSVIISSSFAGVKEDEILQVHDQEVKEMKMPNASNDCFKNYIADGNTEELSEKAMKVWKVVVVNSFDLDDAELINYAYQLGAPRKFHKPLPKFKEPEHRKAKFHLKDRRL